MEAVSRPGLTSPLIADLRPWFALPPEGRTVRPIEAVTWPGCPAAQGAREGIAMAERDTRPVQSAPP
jgi:hypothetical protein